ncbi:unnamed protein product [Rhodiola kirilowii]
MTSASELFCSRRTRLGRGSADPELESGPDLSYSHHHQSNRRNQTERRSGGYSHQSNRRRDLDACLPLRRFSQSRMPGYRTAFTEREPFEVNEGSSQNGPANNTTQEVSSPSNRTRVRCSERLPGAVLQARERLLQRLRGTTISDRLNSRSPFNVSHRNNTFNDDFRLVDAGDWETDYFPRLSPTESSIFHSEPHPVSPVHTKKPPGLTQADLDCLPSEIFNDIEWGCGNQATDNNLVSWDCSICLEAFSNGDKVVRLPCSHRFHLACLGQWVQICGDCPCCRRSII